MVRIIQKGLWKGVAFHSLPIRVKLLLIIAGICTVALVISAFLETALNWASERKRLMDRMHMTAEVISLQSAAALEFLDPQAARENLAALRPDAAIRKACLYDEHGTEFASYAALASDAEIAVCPPVKSQSQVFGWRRLQLYHDVTSNGRKLGSIYLERSLDEMYERFGEEILYRLGIILLVIAIIWPLSSYFQKMISQPVIELAKITRRFSQDRNQNVRAVKIGDDELGELVDAFNVMMEEIRRNERTLGQAIAELTISNRELERFAYICSHDLQEPLRMVSNYTHLLEKRCEGKLDEDTQKFLYFITDGATRMRELINDILTYARMGHHVEPMQKVDLNTVVEYVLQNLDPAIQESRAQIIKEDLPEVMGNKTLLTQIFQNLISNAIKFCKTCPEVRIGADRQERAWQISIHDNGIGIDPKYYDKIFEIFQRLNRREEFRGTGIGLAICKKAVEYHGGRIWLQSQPGKGTSFFFTLPDHPQ